jgi:hypothetical protein
LSQQDDKESSANDFRPLEAAAESGADGGEQESRAIEIGGVLTSYPGSYAAAWRRLLPANASVALPTLYLQRHTLELLLKQVLVALLAIREQRQVSDDLFGLLESAGPVEQADYDSAYASHNLQQLCNAVQRNLTALELPALPAVFNKVIKLLGDVEEGHPDRLRYPTLFARKTRRITRSFGVGSGTTGQKLAPIEEIGGLLMDIFEGQASAFVPTGDTASALLTSAFYRALVVTEEYAEHQLTERLLAIELATRRNEVRWGLVSEPQLNVAEHPTLREAAVDLDRHYATATYCGRMLVLVSLRRDPAVWSPESAFLEDAFLLASRRPNGTLTEGIVLRKGQEELVSCIRRALTPT